KPVPMVWIHAVCEKQLGQFASAAGHCPSLWEVGLVAEHQSEESFVSSCVAKRFWIIGQCRVSCEHRGCSLGIAIVSEEVHGAGGAVGAEQLDHLLVRSHDCDAQRVGRAFDLWIGISAML